MALCLTWRWCVLRHVWWPSIASVSPPDPHLLRQHPRRPAVLMKRFSACHVFVCELLCTHTVKEKPHGMCVVGLSVRVVCVNRWELLSQLSRSRLIGAVSHFLVSLSTLFLVPPCPLGTTELMCIGINVRYTSSLYVPVVWFNLILTVKCCKYLPWKKAILCCFKIFNSHRFYGNVFS